MLHARDDPIVSIYQAKKVIIHRPKGFSSIKIFFKFYTALPSGYPIPSGQLASIKVDRIPTRLGLFA